MHSIDPQWTDLAAGYQAIQSFKTKLTVEFGRAVRVGRKQQLRKELTGWQKKRRGFFALVAMAPLSIIALCVSAIYFREVACVIFYWAVVVLIILVTLAVAGRQYIQEMMNNKPVPKPAEGLVVDLEGRWWQSLLPGRLQVEKAIKKVEQDFLVVLGRFLPDTYYARVFPDDKVLLLGPSGIWIYSIVRWNGTVVKQEGAWKQIQTRRDKFLRKHSEEQICEPGPDDQWLVQKQEIEKTLEKHLPERTWILKLIKGGVVFAHQKVKLDKKRIQGNRASYGLPKAWAGRILKSPDVEGFTVELHLEILDALSAGEGQQTLSAKEQAELLYQQAVLELRDHVAKMVK